MAITDLGSLAFGGSRTANQSTFSVFTTAAVAAGELIVAVTAVDVAGTSSGIDASTYDLRIGGTNGDRFQNYGDRRSNQPGTGSQTGVASTLWWMIAPQAYASGTEIIAKYNSPTESDHSVLIARRFSLSAGNCALIDTGNGLGWTSNVQTTAVDAPSMVVATTNGVQTLRVRSTTGRYVGTSALVSHAPTAGWSSFGGTMSGVQSQTPDWEVSLGIEFIISSATSLTSDMANAQPTVSTNIYVALKEMPIVSGTLAATEGADSAVFYGDGILDLGDLARGGSRTANQSTITVGTTSGCAAGELVVVIVGVDNNTTSITQNDTSVSSVAIAGFNLTRGLTVQANSASQTVPSCVLYFGILPSAVPFASNIVVTFVNAATADHSAVTARHYRVGANCIIEYLARSHVEGGPLPALNQTTSNGRFLRIRGSGIRYAAPSSLSLTPTSGWTAWGGGDSATTGSQVHWEIFARAESIVSLGTSQSSLPTWQDCFSANVYATFSDASTYRTATLAVTETSDVASFSGSAGLIGALAATEASDSASFPGGVGVIFGTIEAYEGAVWITADSTLFTADDDVRQVNTAIIIRDGAVFAGQVLTGPYGIFAATETTTDTAAFTGILGVIGTLVATEGLSASGSNLINHETWTPMYVTLSGTGSIAVTETVDNNIHRIGQSAPSGKASGSFRFSFDYLGVGPSARGVSFALGSSADSLSIELGPNGTLIRAFANGLHVIQKVTITPTTGGLWNAEIYFRAVATFNSIELYLFNVSGGDNYVFPGSGNGILFRGSSLTRAEVDTAAFVGGTGLVGTLAVTDGASTAAFSGTVVWPVITGVVAATEAPDVVAFTGFAQASGTLVATEENDTAAFVGGPVVAGTLAATEVGADTSNFIGFVTNQGTFAAVEDSDTVAFTCSVAWAATLAVTEAVSDSAVFTVMAAERGSASATEGSDIVFFDGWLSKLDEKVGQLQANEDRIAGIYSEPRANSTLVTADNDLYHASIDYYGMDRASFAGGISVTATLTAREFGEDIAVFRVNVPLGGALAATEAIDEAAFTGTTQTLIRMALAAQEGRDTALFSEPLLYLTGVLAAREAADTGLFTIPTWEQVGEGAGLKNELQRMLWLEGQGGRVTWLEGEVEDTSWLQNPDPEMVSLVAEQARITELRP